MGCAGHCLRCGGNFGWCSEHTAGGSRCQCQPVGWQCPACGSGLAPTTARCPCVELPTATPLKLWPQGPQWLPPGIMFTPVTIIPTGEIVAGDPPGTIGGSLTVDASWKSLTVN